MTQSPNAPQTASSAEDAIAALRPGFLESLKTLLDELKGCREKIEAGEVDDELRQKMRFAVHALRGTAASHFFPVISETAGPIERAIVAGDQLTDDGFLAKTDNLMKLCAHALAEEGAG